MKIDLLANLREIDSTKRAGSRRRDRPAFESTRKFVVDVECPQLVCDLDDEKLAEAMAKQLVDIMRTNMLAGLKVDGTPAQPLAQSTIERRQYRLEQELVGGQNSRYSRKEQAKQRRNFKRRYKATKVGKFGPSTNPAPGRNLRGIESGLLLKSMAAEKVGKGWRIYFANIRAIPDRNGTAPVQRALGLGGQLTGGPLLGKIVKQPAAIAAANNAVKAVVLKQKTAMDLLKELQASLENVQQLAETEVD